MSCKINEWLNNTSRADEYSYKEMYASMSKLFCIKPGQQDLLWIFLSAWTQGLTAEWTQCCSVPHVKQLSLVAFSPSVLLSVALWEHGGGWKKQGGTLDVMLKGYSYITAISYARQKPEKWETHGHLLLLLSLKFNSVCLSFSIFPKRVHNHCVKLLFWQERRQDCTCTVNCMQVHHWEITQFIVDDFFQR